jgi:FKBP-type peptidyl-prolyl cis-trans isomerase
LSFAELKEQLKKRGLETTGKRSDLVARLQEAINESKDEQPKAKKQKTEKSEEAKEAEEAKETEETKNKEDESKNGIKKTACILVVICQFSND